MESLFAQGTGPELAAAEVARCYVRVALERGIERATKGRGGGAGGDEPGEIDATLTYRSDEVVEVGERVEVPLGRSDAKAAGVVVESGGPELLARDGADPIPAHKVKPILARAGSRLPPKLVELGRWMAHYYVCPLGMTLATMMPAAVKHGTGVRQRLVIERVHDLDESVVDAMQLTPAARSAWALIQQIPEGDWPVPPRELAARAGAPNLAPINKLLKLGLLRAAHRREVDAARGVWEDARTEAAKARPTLTPRQHAIVAGVINAIRSGPAFGVHLIRGVTGSGKTEVYLRVIEEVLAAGKTALVLVPEISLTPQTAGRFLERFGSPAEGGSGGGGGKGAGVAVLHSGLTAAQRHKQWAAAASGTAHVVVGARSAVFAPLPNLGLIVVDEEHASDYKQDQLPRYHGRDVAVMRAHLEGCHILLGSATPSLESWCNAQGGGVTGGAKYKLWELPDRVGDAELPRVEIVDMIEERKAIAVAAAVERSDPGAARPSHDRPRLIGPTLERALRDTLDAGGQAILLMNRRGFANYICCPKQRCGWFLQCDQCDAAMVYHRGSTNAGDGARGGYVRCHHCLSEQRLPRTCPVCSAKVAVLGAGTQSVEEELGARVGLVENQSMLRVDGDTMHSARDYFAVLSRFAAGELKVLVGTQMIAKGLDFPNVRLVGVIDADTSLSLPDFRAAERTFQLVSQVAGRAGRGEHKGRVVVQTVSPDAPAITHAAAHDYLGFAKQELLARKRSGLPPWTKMARIVVRDQELPKADAHAREVAESLRLAAKSAPHGETLQLIGPMPASIARVNNFHRIALELLSPTRGLLQHVLQTVRRRGLLKSDARTAVDVDPVALM